MSQTQDHAIGACPADGQLAQLVADQVQGLQRAELESHLEACSSCQQKVSTLCDSTESMDWRNVLLRPKAAADPRPEFLERLKCQSPFVQRAIEFPGPPSDAAPLGSLESYDILAELGHGGMGAVYLARDTHLGHRVALKVLLPELAASPIERERFKREGHAAAAVKHDHIVTVHRADTAPDFPLPYLVMEYIEGGSLRTRLERQRPLPPREAAAIVRQISLGLSAAHQKGLVHRDVKPANVLLESETGRAKITDFGLARTVDAGADHLTQHGGAVGTPAYMSPEHILHPQQVDGRSDIYSLGTVLYELLTGERTFAGTTPMILSQTVHEEPRPPRRLNDRVPRDLETICLKCLRKDPADRYATAGDLADDLDRFLDGCPITARPVGRRERWVMWCRRNPWTAGLVSSIAALLVLITVGSLVSAMAIRSAWETEAAARAQAERRSQQARRAVDEMYTQVAEDWLADQPRMQPLQREFLQRALEFYEEFAAEHSRDPAVQQQAILAQRRVADIHYTLGEYEVSDAAYDRAVVLHQALIQQENLPQDILELAVTLANRALMLTTINRVEDAEQAYGHAQQLLEDLVTRYPEVPEYREHLGNCLSGLSQIYKGSGRAQEGVRCCRRAIELQRELVDEFPRDDRYRRDLATSLVHLGLVLEHQGEYVECVQAIDEAIGLQEQLMKASPLQPGYRFDLASTCTDLSRLQRLTGALGEAHQTLMRVLQLQEALVADFPDVPRYRMELSSTLNSLASLLQDVGQLAEAEASFRQALEVQAGLAQEFPDVPDHHMTLAGIKSNLCGLLLRTGRSAEAQQAYVELINEQQQLADRFPDDFGFQVALAISCNNFGNLQERLGQPESAEQTLRRAVAVYQGLNQRAPGNVFLRQNLAGSISNLCRVLSNHGKQDEADAAFRRALDQHQRLADEHPGVPDYQADFASSYDNYGTMLHEMGRIADAEPALRSALELRESLAGKYPDRLDYQRDLAASQNNLGVFYDDTGQPDLARTLYDEARRLREQLVTDHPDEWRFQMELCTSYENLGRHYQRQGKPDEARRWLDLCISRIRTVLEQEPSQQDALQTLRSALATRVPSLAAEGLYQEALTDLDEALRLTPEGTRQIGLRADRVRVLLLLKDYDAVVVEALTAAQQSELTAGGAYRLACVLSLVSAELADAADADRDDRRDQIERLQSRAVELLEQSRELGYFENSDTIEHFEKTTDLDALRHREDFEKLRSKLRVGTQESE
jgi:serine/threonine protein kinase